MSQIVARRERNADKFIAVFGPALTKVLEQFPKEYSFPASFVPTVAERMRKALVDGSYHHEGRAMKAACKELKIEYKRRCIEDFLNKE